ncbi:hypothetical protein ACRALDRAFT_1081365 [Sodiomyces alcalophilus JCM 7366]|uniref:uncharacterized protein n=1 Tax=Sodiomyces alcalophilus JCM 7366 TaxID=591952 RepID=UPI0039B6248C
MTLPSPSPSPSLLLPLSPAAPSDTASRPARLLSRLVLFLLATSALPLAAQTFPYIPTTILLPELLTIAPDGSNFSGANSDFVYIFAPSDRIDNDEAAVELLSLDISATVHGDTNLKVVSSNLPFVDASSNTSTFLPSLTDNGTIVVQAGDCQSPNDYNVWTYTPTGLGLSSTEGVWAKSRVAVSDDQDDSIQLGPHFLGAGITFSSSWTPIISEPALYSYGGMCLSPTSDPSAWQSNAAYSNQMVRLTRAHDRSRGGYEASFVAARGPAFPAAGFTLTALKPSLSNRSDTLIQNRRHVMLGGHTEHAFINMSTAAVWSLPEESWSFLTINEPSQRDDNDDDDLGLELAANKLANRDVMTSVDSRSGHTAVLNEEGDALAILGGWVGTVSQAAYPQLAILRMGDSYGEWTWEIPDSQPDGPALYGHGAALLPGNVMMVYGGYEVTDPGDNAAVEKRNTRRSPRFLNLTSMSWDSAYENPVYTGGDRDSTDSNGGRSNDNDRIRTIGLGVGIGVGSLAIIGAILVWFCHRRRLKRKRREDTVRDLAQDASRFLREDDDDMMERNDFWSQQPWYTGGRGPYDLAGGRSLGYETLRGSRSSLQGGYGTQPPPGLFVPRKPVPRAARGAYQPALSHTASLTSPGSIHPIYEADEEDPDDSAQTATHDRNHDPAPDTPASPTYSDPFATPTAGLTSAPATYFPPSRASATPSPTRDPSHHRIDPEVQDWKSDVDAAEALLAQIPARSRAAASNHRDAPTRRPSVRSAASTPVPSGADDERSASGLSDSNRSAFSNFISRSFLTGPTTTAAATAAAAGANTNGDGRLGTSGSNSSSSSNTFTTATSGFGILQAEGPSLLQRTERDGHLQQHRRGNGYAGGEDEDDIFIPGSPSKNKPRRQQGWLGSIRRVFSAGGGAGRPGRETSSNTESEDGSGRSISPTRRSLDGQQDETSTTYESRLLGLSSIGGAELLRRKQGRRGWEVDDTGEYPSDKMGREEGSHGSAHNGEPGVQEDEWDIEKEIEKRLVQVMFTVPREKLRVVNGDEADLDQQEGEEKVVDPEEQRDKDDKEPKSPFHAQREKTAMTVAAGYPNPSLDPEKRTAAKESSPKPGPLRIRKQTPSLEKINTNVGSPNPAILGMAKWTGRTDGPWAPAPDRTGRTLLDVPSIGDGTARRGSSGSGGTSMGDVSPGAESFGDDGGSSITGDGRHSATIHTAEAVRFARPRTKVLEMVETFETKSRESSPSKSVRSGRGR